MGDGPPGSWRVGAGDEQDAVDPGAHRQRGLYLMGSLPEAVRVGDRPVPDGQVRDRVPKRAAIGRAPAWTLITVITGGWLLAPAPCAG
jgi:hypothetical protein